MNIKKCLVAVLSIIMIFSELSISASADTKPKFDGKTKINTLPGCIEQVDVIGVKHTNCKAKSSNSKIKIKKSYWTDYTYFFISANEKAKGKISFYYRKDANSEFKKLKTIFFKCCSKSEAKSKLKKSLNNKTIKIGKGQLSSIKPFKNYNEKYKIRFVSKKPKQLVIDKKKLNKKDDSDVFEWLSENEIVTNSLNVFSKKCGKLKINVYYTGTKRPIFIGSLNVKTITKTMSVAKKSISMKASNKQARFDNIKNKYACLVFNGYNKNVVKILSKKYFKNFDYTANYTLKSSDKSIVKPRDKKYIEALKKGKTSIKIYQKNKKIGSIKINVNDTLTIATGVAASKIGWWEGYDAEFSKGPWFNNYELKLYNKGDSEDLLAITRKTLDKLGFKNTNIKAFKISYNPQKAFSVQEGIVTANYDYNKEEHYFKVSETEKINVETEYLCYAYVTVTFDDQSQTVFKYYLLSNDDD